VKTTASSKVNKKAELLKQHPKQWHKMPTQINDIMIMWDIHILHYYIAETALHDELSDSDGEEVHLFCNPREKYLQGMLKGKKYSRHNVESRW